MTVRAARRDDWWWLTRQGLAPELVGRQYHWLETPLQLVVAPTRGLGWRDGPRAIIEVEGERAGYIGRNPLSGNLEYFVAARARGGVGRQAIAAFLATGRAGDRPRRFYVSHANPRSRAALLGACADLGWIEGEDYEIVDAARNWWITVGPGVDGGGRRTLTA